MIEKSHPKQLILRKQSDSGVGSKLRNTSMSKAADARSMRDYIDIFCTFYRVLN